jgi:hypothetical protein
VAIGFYIYAIKYDEINGLSASKKSGFIKNSDINQISNHEENKTPLVKRMATSVISGFTRGCITGCVYGGGTFGLMSGVLNGVINPIMLGIEN